jgi:hypothetical protein
MRLTVGCVLAGLHYACTETIKYAFKALVKTK